MAFAVHDGGRRMALSGYRRFQQVDDEAADTIEMGHAPAKGALRCAAAMRGRRAIQPCTHI